MTTDQSVDLARWTTARRREIEAVLQERLPAPAPGADPGRLVESMRYSLLAPGKRLRPLVAMAAADAVAASIPRSPDEPRDDAVLVAAAAVELVHCYSLVHDDLPAMDDDDIRRGRPSNHKVFGEATAILAGDALLTLAFEWLAESGERSGRPGDFNRATLALARGAGVTGMVRGQARDLGETPPRDLAELERLHVEKTAALFRAAAEMGAAAAGATAIEIEAVGTFGARFGVAFQHADDREDGDHPALRQGARQRVPVLLAEAVAALDRLPTRLPDRLPPNLPVRPSAVPSAVPAAVLRALAGQLLTRAGAPPAPPTSDR